MSSVPLSCERCKATWNYSGNALNDSNKRVHCSKCNSTKIYDSLGNKVNLGFVRAKKSKSNFDPKDQQTPPDSNTQQDISDNQQISESNIQQENSDDQQQHQQQQTPTLDLNDAKKLINSPIPNVDKIKQQIQQQNKQKTEVRTKKPDGTTTTVTTYGGVQTTKTDFPEWTGDDFKIVYSLLDDIIVYITKNRSMEHSNQRKKEMGELLAKILNKHGLNGAIELVFVISHIAYVSPLLFHLRKRKDKKEETSKQTTNNTTKPKKDLPEEKSSETITEKQTKTVEPNIKERKKYNNSIFSKGDTMTVESFLKKK